MCLKILPPRNYSQQLHLNQVSVVSAQEEYVTVRAVPRLDYVALHCSVTTSCALGQVCSFFQVLKNLLLAPSNSKVLHQLPQICDIRQIREEFGEVLGKAMKSLYSGNSLGK